MIIFEVKTNRIWRSLSTTFYFYVTRNFIKLFLAIYINFFKTCNQNFLELE